MPVIEPLSGPRGGPNLRRRVLNRVAAPWLTMFVAVIGLIAVALATIPSPTSAVSAAIQRGGPPGLTAIGRSTTSAARPARLVAMPATMALAGSDAQILVIPTGLSTGVSRQHADPSAVSWWITGQRPGASGRAVAAGQVEPPAGRAVRPAFDELEEGDPILLTGADGRVHRYLVTDRREYSQTRLEMSLLADTGSSGQLLISFAGRLSDAGWNDITHLLITAGEVVG